MLFDLYKPKKIFSRFSDEASRTLRRAKNPVKKIPAIILDGILSWQKEKIIRIGNKAFTLLELMIVIAIISVLATIAMPHYKKYVERTERTALIQTIRMLEREITLFQLSNGRYPDDLDELGLGAIEDPWGNPFRYLNIADADGKFTGKNKPRKDHSLHPVNTDYDLYSMGPDGKTNIPFTAKASQDDFVRANNGSFLGSVSDY